LLHWDHYNWNVFWPIIAFIMGAWSPLIQQYYWKGEMLGRKRRALMWGGLANIFAQLFYVLFANIYARDDSFENIMLYNFITIGSLFQGLAYHFAYNGQYQNY